MEHRDVLIDTCIIIDFLRSREKERTALWRLMDGYFCHLSSVSVFELYAGATSDNRVSDVARIVQWIKVIPFDEPVAQEAGRLYRELRRINRLIEFRDLFISATARINAMALATKNTGHFLRVPGIRLLDIKGL